MSDGFTRQGVLQVKSYEAETADGSTHANRARDDRSSAGSENTSVIVLSGKYRQSSW